ncbi:MAG: metallophosphoesterase family protein [Acidimicrobiales bacterium]
MELTTVADDEAVVHDGFDVRRYPDLEPDQVYEIEGFAFRTLARPGGEHLCTFATVNDVHFGEVECGIIEGLDIGPTFAVAEGEQPYPEMMNRAAVAEIEAIDPTVVVVKGDLTSRGTVEEYQDFLDVYSVFGDRLHHIRGNHESYNHATFAADAPFVVDVPGARLAVIDTSLDGKASGGVSADTLSWLDDVAAGDGLPILLFGHHHVWSPESANRPDNYFGVNPADSERLVELVARRPRIRGYFAGHTHRNRVRRFGLTRDVPWVEVASVKEFPGSWAEYRVFEGGVLQIHRRISSPEALIWSEKTRHLYADTYFDYSFGALDDRCFAIPATAP